MHQTRFRRDFTGSSERYSSSTGFCFLIAYPTGIPTITPITNHQPKNHPKNSRFDIVCYLLCVGVVTIIHTTSR